MKDLCIRKLLARDAERVSHIFSEITPDHDPAEFTRMVEDEVRRDWDASIVAELDGTVVGVLISYIHSGGFGIKKSAWIALMGVDTRYMGQGIGKRLAEEIFMVYLKEGVRHIYTSVRWDSTDLLSFFKSLGFDRSNFINLHKRLDPA